MFDGYYSLSKILSSEYDCSLNESIYLSPFVTKASKVSVVWRWSIENRGDFVFYLFLTPDSDHLDSVG